MNDPTEPPHSSRFLVGLAWLVRAGLPFLILWIGYLAFHWLSLPAPAEPPPPAPPQVIKTSVSKLAIQDYPVVVRTYGIVQSHNQVAISAQVIGEVARVQPQMEVGAFFSAGDVLIELDRRDFELALRAAKARLHSANAKLLQVSTNLTRVQKLSQSSASTDADLDQAVADKELAIAELEIATSQMQQSEEDLDRTRIVAPFDGRVLQKQVGVGQRVGPGEPLGVVYATDFVEVRLPISTRELPFLDLPEFADDEPLEVELTDAIGKRDQAPWKAQIVRTDGSIDANSLELYAIARVHDPYGRKSTQPSLRIGQPVLASIRGTILRDVFAIPRSAVRQLDQVVLVDRESMTLSKKTVVPVWSDENHIVIRDPTISANVLLATSQLVNAPEGASVEIIPSTIESPTITGVSEETVADESGDDSADTSGEESSEQAKADAIARDTQVQDTPVRESERVTAKRSRSLTP